MALNMIARIGGRRLYHRSCARLSLNFEFPKLTQQQWVISKVGVSNQNIVPPKKLSTHTGENDSDSVSCWKCGINVDLNKVLFCDYCEVVQKPKVDADYFEILGMEKNFHIDTKKLTRNFRLLQMQLHPDRFSQKSEDEKKISASYSSLLNQAYKTLNSQLDRGLYLLEIAGVPLKEGDEITLGPEFLNEIMEINEEIHEVENSSDLQRIKEINKIAMDDLYRRVTEGFKNQNLESARECLARLKYFSKIEERIKELQQELDEERC